MTSLPPDVETDLREENARLARELRAAQDRQAATADILRVISQSPTDVGPVFEAIVLAIARLIRCDRSFVLRCDKTSFWLVASARPEGLLPILEHGKSPIDPNANFPSRAIMDQKTLHLPDWSKIDLPEHERHIHTAYGINAALLLPLLRNGECIGVLSITGKQARIFDESEIALAESFRDQALIAIENTRLFNETQEALERQTATSEVLGLINSSPGDLNTVFEAMVEKARRLCDADSGQLALPVGDDFRTAVVSAMSPDLETIIRSVSYAPGRGTAVGRSLLERRAVQIADIAADSEHAARHVVHGNLVRTILGVPLLREGEPIGAFGLSRARVEPFTERQIELVETFAAQAVVAIENARLFNETKEALERQTATADILKVIASSPSNVQPVFDSIVKSAARLFAPCSATITTLKDGAMHWNASAELVATFDHDRASAMYPIPFDPEHSPSARALLTRRIVEISDILDPETPDFTRRIGVASGFRSITFVPLIHQARGIGTIILTHPKAGFKLSEKQLALVQTFADQAVIAIENARLFEEVQARTEDLRESLDELRTAQDRLVQTEKLASLGQLTAGIAHEIKNPLNFVNNFSALSAELTDELSEVLKPAALDDKTREEVGELTQMLKDNLAKVVQHGKRADSIVKNMLLHSREGSGEHRPADINALVDESLNLAYHGARAEKPGFNVTLQKDFDETAGTIEMFPQEITRVFLNLISNGFYAATKRKMENGGSGFEPIISATTKNLGHAVEIRIRDNGAGIPPEVKEKMFNPFFTTKPAGEGTGLGLSMSYDIIVKQHGGRIDVETEPDRFTEFTVILPRTNNPANKEKTRGQP